MPRDNISDWLSFLNERIGSYEATQNSHLTTIFVILGFILTMTGITITTAKGMDLVYIFGQILCIAGLIIIDIAIFVLWRLEGRSPNYPYQQVLQIRIRILKGTLVDTNDIYQECFDTRIL